MFGLAVTCLAFGAATREEPSAETGALEAAAAHPRFFAETPAASVPAPFVFPTPPALPLAARTRVPIEALLLQIENHVRLEQAAAECYLESPNAALLHSRTVSTLVN
jgi:hypothetical protein